MQRPYRLALASLTAGVAALGAVGTARVDAGSAADRTILVSVMDSNGAPVGDLKEAEFAIKEDGADRTITRVEPAKAPIYYAVLLDTTPAASPVVNDVRDALTGFCKLLLSVDSSAKFAFMEFGGAAMMRQDFTSNLAEIEAVILKMLPKPSESVMNEALLEIARTMQKLPEGSRRVIVTINMEPTKESSNVAPRQIADEIRKSGASVWSIALQSGSRRDANREAILKGLTANAGGRWVPLQSPTQLAPFLRSVAANSYQQYAVTYTRPDGDKPPKVTDVTVSRPSVVPLAIKWSSEQ
jgi:VWFA-related protein